jgi:hypothetical protein
MQAEASNINRSMFLHDVQRLRGQLTARLTVALGEGNKVGLTKICRQLFGSLGVAKGETV